ncbi:MAG: hypothetical protein ACLPWG_22255 [Steroidobacteraceae bacterium]
MIQDGSRKRTATSIVVRDPFSFAQLLNAPIQINRGAVLKSCESMMVAGSVKLACFIGLQACRGELRMMYWMPQTTKSDTKLRDAVSVASDAIWVACCLLLSLHRKDASRITHIFREVC